MAGVVTGPPQPYEYDLDDPLVYRNEMGRYKTARQLEFIRGQLSGPSLRILDIGGGGGRIAVPLAQDGHHVTVVDISQQALDLLTARTGETVDVALAGLMSYEPPAPFDVALMIDTLKYVTEVSVTEEFAKINWFLPVGGLLVVAEINQGSFRTRLSERLGRRDRWYNIATREGYRRALVDAGFETAQEQGFSWMPLPFNSNSRSVGWFGRLETGLRLGRWLGASPWLLIAARKVAAPSEA